MRQVTFDSSRLPGHFAYNACLRRTSAGYEMAYRAGKSYDSDLARVALTEDFRVRRDTCEFMPRPFAEFQSYEDPRFLDSRVYFVAWAPDACRVCTTDRVLAARQPVEKNWVMFQYGARILATYSMRGGVHSVVDPLDEKLPTLYETAYDPGEWEPRFGEVRGGTNYVRSGDEMIAVFHSRKQWVGKNSGKRYTQYSCGAVAVRAEPPFDVVGLSVEPLPFPVEWIDGRRWKDFYVFPCGLTDDWVCSCGYNDREVRLFQFTEEELRRSCGL